VADIQKNVAKWAKRNPVSRHLNAKKDKETIAARRVDLDRILQVFNVRPVAWVMTVTNFPLLESTNNNHPHRHFGRPG